MSRLSLETQGVSLMQLSVDRCCGVAGSWRVLTQWRTQKISTGGASVCIIPSGPFPLMVMHTLCAGFVRSPQRLDLAQLTKILAHPLGFARTLITPRNRIAKKITYFSDRGCVRPLRHLYGYATVLRYSEKRLMRPCRIAFAALHALHHHQQQQSARLMTWWGQHVDWCMCRHDKQPVVGSRRVTRRDRQTWDCSHPHTASSHVLVTVLASAVLE